MPTPRARDLSRSTSGWSGRTTGRCGVSRREPQLCRQRRAANQTFLLCRGAPPPRPVAPRSFSYARGDLTPRSPRSRVRARESRRRSRRGALIRGDFPLSQRSQRSDPKFFGIPLEPQLARWRHVADERRGSDDGGAREIAFAAQSHPILPVAIERGDRALTLLERVRALAEARPAPRLTDRAANGSKHVGDRLAVEPRIRPLDLAPHAAGAPEDHELLRRVIRPALLRRTDDERRCQQIVVAAVGA